MSTVTIPKSPPKQKPADQAAEQKFEYPAFLPPAMAPRPVVHVEIPSPRRGAYPITSSTTMGGGFNAAVMNGVKNLWAIRSCSSPRASIPPPRCAKASPSQAGASPTSLRARASS